jgi:preprotein translocase subunit SecD
MKTIKYFLRQILFISVIALSTSGIPAPRHSILLQSSDKDVSLISLNQSAEIITKRLNYLGKNEFSISVIPEKKQIRIEYPDNFDPQMVENLVISNGEIGFYETFSQNEVLALLNGDNQLFTLLTKSNTDRSDAMIGCASLKEAARVDDYLKTIDNEHSIRFVWSQGTDRPEVCLYALKITDGKGAIVTNTDIQSAVYDQDRIKIKLSNDGASAFAGATKRNLGKVIAVLLDGKVISAPKVMSEMNSGEIEITGNFTGTEGSYIAAVLSTDILPVDFHIVK